MRSRLRAAALLAVAAGLLAATEVVWLVAFLGRASDGPAFVIALVVQVLIPTLLVAIGAVLVDAIPRRTRVALTAAVAASGFAAAGVEAGVFVGDDPADPAFIRWVSDVPQLALVAAALLMGVAAWGLLRPLPLIARILLTVVAAIVGPVVLAVVLLTGVPVVVLLALGAPVVLVTVTVVLARQQRRQAAV